MLRAVRGHPNAGGDSADPRAGDTRCSGAWCRPPSVSISVTAPTDLVVLARLRILLIFPVVQPETASPRLGHVGQSAPRGVWLPAWLRAAVVTPFVLRPKLVPCSTAFSRGCTTRAATPAPASPRAGVTGPDLARRSAGMCRRDSIGFRIPSDDRPRAWVSQTPAVRHRQGERRHRPLLCAPASGLGDCVGSTLGCSDPQSGKTAE
jgi:hypothetical protein